MALPALERLDRLAARFIDAERRVRHLLRQAPTGNRRRLLIEALEILLDLRRHAQGAGAEVELAYLVAALTAGTLTGRPSPTGARAHDLGRGLAGALDGAVVKVEADARRAFASVTADTLAGVEADVLAARIDAAGNRWPLSVEVSMQTETVGAHAVSRATADTLGQGAQVTISAHSTKNPICAPLEGQTKTVGVDRLPPYHARCKHLASPVGATETDHVEAMRDAVGAVA